MQHLLIELKQKDIKLSLENGELRVSAPQGTLNDALKQNLRDHKLALIALLSEQKKAQEKAQQMASSAQERPPLSADLSQRHQPFELTDLQHAYWLGRDSALDMGNVATHLYVELECEALDIERLNQALAKMIARHDMLRAVLDKNGQQRILQEVPSYSIAIKDCVGKSHSEVEAVITETRAQLSHQVLDAYSWPLFDIRATRRADAGVQLHVSLDLLILDAWSIFLFFKEWHAYYCEPQLAKPAFEISFREYVVAEKARQESDAVRYAQTYWMQRVDELPPAPALPTRLLSAEREAPRFSRREARLAQHRWQKLRDEARQLGLTPSGLLLSCYAEVLARWSSTPHFTLNVTVSNRQNIHPEVNQILGDFTSLIMEEIDWRDANTSFLQRALRQQKQFQTDLDHLDYNGVAVMREWAKRRGTSLQAAMPVVFSSGLIWSGDQEPGNLEQFGKKTYSISQTSQVWLDHHVMEIDGDLVFIWDALDAAFEEDVLDAMFSSYCQLIEALADDSALWHQRELCQLPALMSQQRIIDQDTGADLPSETIHAGMLKQAQLHPDAVAIIAKDRRISYAQLLAESCAVADHLLNAGISPAEPVAVVMHKGWEQVVAVFGILLAGGAYLPIDANLPTQRKLDLLDIVQVKHLLVQVGADHSDLKSSHRVHYAIQAQHSAVFSERHQSSLQAPLEQLAYVIFTSGTTGVPKAVMIDHRGAVNTLMHINRLFKVKADDRVLAVSSLSFDLSVYDIFGVLAVGAALVIPDHQKGNDAVHWHDLMVEHGVTLWNSAPQLMRMLMDSFYADEASHANISKVLLSGDFIPLDLPDRIRQRYPQAQLYSLGGATEASIWSNYFPIKTVLAHWQSIPYGKALPNQTICVLDHALRPCADHVRGKIYIGGIGLALAYWGDAKKTAERFITHPISGERLYDTGDLGRYASDGNITILGRDDGQIKIRGHRVELGEIETVLRQHTAIKQAIVIAIGAREHRQLAAYLVANNKANLEIEAVKTYLADRLPEYMVPRAMIIIDAIPVSANGKMNLKALPEITEEMLEQGPQVAASSDIERSILSIWQSLMPGMDIGVTDNFFELGGDSVLATQLVRELNAALPVAIEMHELFENLSIAELAKLVESRIDQPHTMHTNKETAPSDSSDPQLQLKADLAEMRSQVARLNFQTGAQPFSTSNEYGMPNTVFMTGASGWVGSHVLAELLRNTKAVIYALVRADTPEQGHWHIVEKMREVGITFEFSWAERIRVVCGDLAHPQLGLDAQDWRRLAQECDSIFHFAASKNVLHDYAQHRIVNVLSLIDILQLATEGLIKPIFVASPMAVGRRHIQQELMVHTAETALPDPTGLLTAYAESKWCAEQVLLAAAQAGLPLRIYRTSHALPASATHSPIHTTNDTYGTVLKVACAAGLIPDWRDSAIHGAPVDVFARLLVADAIAGTAPHRQAIVHIENRQALSLTEILHALIGSQVGEQARRIVSQSEWRQRCLEVADQLAPEDASLAKILFAQRAQGSAVEHMFSGPALQTTHFEQSGQAALLDHLTPSQYWRSVAQRAQWMTQETLQ